MHRWFPLLFLVGCSRWAYGPTWSATQVTPSVAVSYDGDITCGELSVANTTAKPITVAWSDVHALLPWGERRETLPYVMGGATPPDDAAPIAPGERTEQTLCTDLRLFVVKPRPPTAFDFALGWFFGTGVLAGNVAWEPGDSKRAKVIPDPESYGWELVVPITGDGLREPVRLLIRGDGVASFKYTDWAHGVPDELEQTRAPRGL